LWGQNLLKIFGFWAIILSPDVLESQSRAQKTRMMF